MYVLNLFFVSKDKSDNNEVTKFASMFEFPHQKHFQIRVYFLFYVFSNKSLTYILLNKKYFSSMVSLPEEIKKTRIGVGDRR